MKKLIDKNAFIIFLLVQLICYCNNKIYAYSDEFNLMIEAMDIEITNVNGLKLNEEVYNEYQLFVYGSPLIAYKGQRWKNVEDGHWSMGSGAWNGSGIRGEYWILGENYNGKEVHNHLFPVDIEPPTSPTQWRYAVISDALESWQDASKYMDDTQREYMLTQKLTRNNITYDLTVPDIGLDKVDNTSDREKPVSDPQQEALDALEKGICDHTINGYKVADNPVLTKTDIGLDQVDNTADLDKPISTATQNALDQKAPINSPIFTGIPEVETSPDPEDSSQRIPSTNWVRGRIDESFNQVNSGLGDHVSDYQNPHRVTAEQVGTYDEHEIDDLLDNKADLVNGKVPSYQLPDSTISWIEVE